METINYPYLPEGRVIRYVPVSHPLMMEARRICEKQTGDTNHPTGSVVVLAGDIIGSGANTTPLKSPTLRAFHKNRLCVRRLFHVKTGERYWLCPGCASPQNHSERVAVRDAFTTRHDIAGADLYLWGHWWCCKPCWDAMIAAGIANVYLAEDSEKMFV